MVMLSECPAEVVGIIETTAGTDLLDRQFGIGVAQQAFGHVHLEVKDIGSRAVMDMLTKKCA